MHVEGRFEVAAAPDVVFRYITDAALMARCVPGCEAVEAQSPTSYRARVVVEVASMKARFNLTVEITEAQAPLFVRSKTRGEEGSRASLLAADNEVSLAAVSNGTEVRYTSDVSITGRLGKFALGMMKKKVESLGAEFAARFRAAIETELARAASATENHAPHAAPLS